MKKNNFITVMIMAMISLWVSAPLLASPFLPGQEEGQNKTETLEKKTPPDGKFVHFYQGLIRVQKKINRSVSDSLSGLKEHQDLRTLLLLLAFSFLYGVLHALGPGHGKTILTAWIAGVKVSLRQVLIAAAGSMILHALTAVLAVTLSWFIMKSLLNIDDSLMINIFKGFSGLILFYISYILIANTISYLRAGNKKGGRPRLSASPYAMAAAVGLGPCPVSALILVFAITYGVFGYGLLAAAAFALGLAVTLSIIGSAVWFIKNRAFIKMSRRFSRVFKILVSVVLPLVSAVLLLSIGLLYFLAFIDYF